MRRNGAIAQLGERLDPLLPEETSKHARHESGRTNRRTPFPNAPDQAVDLLGRRPKWSANLPRCRPRLLRELRVPGVAEHHRSPSDLHESAVQCVFPHAQPRARRSPSLHRLRVASGTLRDPFEQLECRRRDDWGVHDLESAMALVARASGGRGNDRDDRGGRQSSHPPKARVADHSSLRRHSHTLAQASSLAPHGAAFRICQGVEPATFPKRFRGQSDGRSDHERDAVAIFTVRWSHHMPWCRSRVQCAGCPRFVRR